MTKPLKTYKQFDIVAIPFPFSDKLEQKKRPALVISSPQFNSSSEHLVTVMITSAKHSSWPLDTIIKNTQEAGLSTSCLIRMKFFTVDKSLVLRTVGCLSNEDLKNFSKNLKQLF
jgi:mRNA interferase MazF